MIDKPIDIFLLLTSLAFLPALLFCLTPFLRLTVVLHFLRQALGTAGMPSNQVLLGIALVLSLAAVQSTVQQLYEGVWMPYARGQLTLAAAMSKADGPIRSRLSPFVREKELQVMTELSNTSRDSSASAPLRVLVGAYVLSELRVAFQMGAVLYLPFLVVDIVVACVLLSAGLMQLPPVLVSAPLKVLLFVLADGWTLVVSTLTQSIRSL